MSRSYDTKAQLWIKRFREFEAPRSPLPSSVSPSAAPAQLSSSGDASSPEPAQPNQRGPLRPRSPLRHRIPPFSKFKPNPIAPYK